MRMTKETTDKKKLLLEIQSHFFNLLSQFLNEVIKSYHEVMIRNTFTSSNVLF